MNRLGTVQRGEWATHRAESLKSEGEDLTSTSTGMTHPGGGTSVFSAPLLVTLPPLTRVAQPGFPGAKAKSLV